MDTQVVLIFILNDVQYSQKVVQKGSHCQNHSSSGFLLPAKKFAPVKFLIPSSHFTSPSLTAILKTTHTFHPLKKPSLVGRRGWSDNQWWGKEGFKRYLPNSRPNITETVLRILKLSSRAPAKNKTYNNIGYLSDCNCNRT